MANQAIRQEINLYDSLISGESTSTGTVTKLAISQLDTTQYSGTPTYFFEVVGQGSAGNTGTFNLRRKGTTTDDATVTTTSATNVLLRSSSFTPPAGQTEYVFAWVGDGTHTQAAQGARIIVLQSEVSISKTETQIEIGAQDTARINTAVADMTNPKFWTYTAANWDGTKTFFVEVTFLTSAANTCTISLCRTSDNAANVTIVSAQTSTTAKRTRVSFTPVDGETYKIRCLGSTTKSTYTIHSAKIIVDQGATPTKVEAQFLMLNRNMTGLSGQRTEAQTKWNASEWNAGAGTITYKNAMDSDNAANSCKITDVTASSDITNSTVTGTGQQVSSALGAFTDGNILETNLITDTGNIAGTRILVIYAFVAAAAAALPELTTEPLTPSRWHQY